jgi:predicted lipoprotein with Yx(FWY)xxD motif
MTLYSYSKDTPGVSNCTGLCATFWPPYTAPASQELVVGVGVNGIVGTIKGSNHPQITYKGMPLYFWSNDKKPGNATGQNINGFTVVAP